MGKKPKKLLHNIFRSRYGTNREITQISDSVYQISGTTRFMRGGFKDNKDEGLNFIDFEGGPFIKVGMKIADFGVKDKREVFKIETIPSDEKDYLVVRVEVT